MYSLQRAGYGGGDGDDAMTRVTKFDNRDAATMLHFLAKYDYVARLPRYPSFAWRALSSRFRRLAAAYNAADTLSLVYAAHFQHLAVVHSVADMLGLIAADCWQRAELPEWRDRRRRRWTWGFAPLAVTVIVAPPPVVTAPPSDNLLLN